MDKSINILDQDYSLWIQDLSKRYRQSQIKAALKVNTEMLKFYWSLSRDIVAMKARSSKISVLARISMPSGRCLSPAKSPPYGGQQSSMGRTAIIHTKYWSHPY